jgi:two-component system sensor histidine kinase UhpB
MDIAPGAGQCGDMTTVVDERISRDRSARPGPRTPVSALFWRLLVFNAAIAIAAVAVLTLSPLTVSAPVSVAEVAVLTVGSALMLACNALWLRATLKPLDGLTALMQRVDLLRPGARVSVTGQGDIAQLTRTFNDMLNRLEHERRASSAHALAAQEAERQRISRELHDEIGQGLTAALLGLKRTVDRAPDALKPDLQAVQEMVRGTLDEVGQVARRLRPGVLEDLGLRSAMHALAVDFEKASQIPVEVVVDSSLPDLSTEAELVVYRIAQEGLTNVARHSAANRASLTLTEFGLAVQLKITDDGRGISGSTEGAGIRGMRERAVLIGAELALGGAPGGGTELRLTVPTS